jgi:hypothetical protein
MSLDKSYCSFAAGWIDALSSFESGQTWEWITHVADDKSPTFGRGMVAGVDAMSGWLDIARRAAKAHGIAEEQVEYLIRKTRGEKDLDNHG